jgi:beta-N-acetylhexosaminidase
MSARSIPLGPVQVAIAGLALAAADRERLLHPMVGGVILFAPNFSDREQLSRLCADIHGLREPPLLISADQEGGRVQRFREGFTRLPPMRRIGEVWDHDPDRAKRLARACGLTMAAELLMCGVDLSLAPVLDIDHGASTIIGDRAFHSSANAITEVAAALIDGMRAAGMASVGKHFPGHGYIAADSHLELPIDDRSFDAIERCDLVPFAGLAGKLDGIMPAHVVYPQVDAKPAGFSAVWIRDILRTRLGFAGAVFSDDLGMAGAAGEGALHARAHAAFAAGCDLVLACTPEGADALLAELRYTMPAEGARRLAALTGAGAKGSLDRIGQHPDYLQSKQVVSGAQG